MNLVSDLCIVLASCGRKTGPWSSCLGRWRRIGERCGRAGRLPRREGVDYEQLGEDHLIRIRLVIVGRGLC